MLKDHCFAAVLVSLFAPICVFAQTAPAPADQPAPYVFVKLFRSNADPEKYAEPGKAAELLDRRQKRVKALHDAKKTALREDPELVKLQQEMRKLADRMTLLIESRESVKKINSEIKKIDGELDALPLKGQKTPAVK